MVAVIEVTNLKKTYDPYGVYPKVVLNGLDMKVDSGEFICVMGASGSGKTTLINVVSTMDTMTSGSVKIVGQDVYQMTEKQKAKIRKQEIGFIFQDYNLIDSLTIKDNIMFAFCSYRKTKKITKRY